MREYAKFDMKKLLSIITLIFSISISASYFPGNNTWLSVSPEEEGVSPEKVNRLLDLSFMKKVIILMKS